MAVGRPRAGVLAAAQPAAELVDRHDVVEVQADADEPVGARALEGGDDQPQRADQVRGERHEQLALEQGLADQAQVEVLQVAQAAVDELARAAGGAAGIVGLLDERDRVSARGGVERHAGAGDPAADHDDVEGVRAQRLQGGVAGDHGAGV